MVSGSFWIILGDLVLLAVIVVVQIYPEMILSEMLICDMDNGSIIQNELLSMAKISASHCNVTTFIF